MEDTMTVWAEGYQEFDCFGEWVGVAFLRQGANGDFVVDFYDGAREIEADRRCPVASGAAEASVGGSLGKMLTGEIAKADGTFAGLGGDLGLGSLGKDADNGYFFAGEGFVRVGLWTTL